MGTPSDETQIQSPTVSAGRACERAAILAEVYRRAAWRFAAVAQGFVGGPVALFSHFGRCDLAPAPRTCVSSAARTMWLPATWT